MPDRRVLPRYSDYRLFTPQPTRWGDADALGHINNVMFVRYIESGRLDYFDRLCGMKLEPGLKRGFVLADLQVSFLQQVHHPSELIVATRVSRLGNSSFDVDASIFIKDQKDPVFTSKGICVWFDFDRNASQPVPAEIRDAIIKFEEGTVS